MQDKITYRIHAEEVHKIIRIDYVSSGFAHLVITLEKPWVSEHLLGQRLPKSH